MLHNVSWAAYSSFISWILIFYYGTIGWIFYRKNIYLWLSRSVQSSPQNFSSPLAESLVMEVCAYASQAATEELPSYIIIQKLKSIVQKYNGLQTSPDKQVINTRIGVEVEKRCSISLTREELNQLWTG